MVMQWVTVRIRVMDRDRVRVKFTVRVRVSVSCAFSEAFVGIAAVGIAACTRVIDTATVGSIMDTIAETTSERQQTG